MRYLVFIILVVALSGCGLREPIAEVEFTGRIGDPGITSYQYGTHIITNGDQRYALRSETIDLDEYKGEKVIIWGDPIEGYPIEGGPLFLVVKKVEEYP